MNVAQLNTDKRLLTAIMPWKNISLGNAAIVSRTIAKSGFFTSTQTFKIEVPLAANEEVTRDYEGYRQSLDKLDADGVIRVGESVSLGEVLVAMIEYDTRKHTPEESLLKAIFSDSAVRATDRSITMSFRDPAMVYSVEKQLDGKNKSVTIYLAFKRELRLGDILVDSKGNQAIVSAIVEDNEMPYLKGNDVRAQIVVTAPSDCALTLENYLDDTSLVVVYNTEDAKFILIAPPLEKHSNNKKWLCKDEKARFGTVVWKKLELLSPQKNIGYGIQNRLRNDGQLTDGVKVKQEFIHSLLLYNLPALAQEFLTIKADDIAGYEASVHAILGNNPLPAATAPASLKRYEAIIKAMGLTLGIDNNHEQLGLLAGYDQPAPSAPGTGLSLWITPQAEILAGSQGELTNSEYINHIYAKMKSDKVGVEQGLFSQRIFGPLRDYECACGKYKRIRYKGIVCDRCHVLVEHSSIRKERFGHIELALPCVHPLFAAAVSDLNKAIDYTKTEPYFEELIEKNIDHDNADYLFEAADIMEKLALPEALWLKVIPVIPAGWRSDWMRDGGWVEDLNMLYRRLMIRNNRMRRLIDIKAPWLIIGNEYRMLQAALSDLFDYTHGGDVQPPLGLIHSLQAVGRNLYEKKVSYSGRGLVIPDDTLAIDECVLPRTLAVRLFEPFVLHLLMAEPSGSLDPEWEKVWNDAYPDVPSESDFEKLPVGTRIEKQLISDYPQYSYKKARELACNNHPEATEKLELAARDKVVLISSTNQTDFAGFRPRFSDEEAIRLHPQAIKHLDVALGKAGKVLVHLPLSETAQTETKRIMSGMDWSVDPERLGNYVSVLNTKLNQLVSDPWIRQPEPGVCKRLLGLNDQFLLNYSK